MNGEIITALYAFWWLGGALFAGWAWRREADLTLGQAVAMVLLCGAVGPLAGVVMLLADNVRIMPLATIIWRRALKEKMNV